MLLLFTLLTVSFFLTWPSLVRGPVVVLSKIFGFLEFMLVFSSGFFVMLEENVFDFCRVLLWNICLKKEISSH